MCEDGEVGRRQDVERCVTPAKKQRDRMFREAAKVDFIHLLSHVSWLWEEQCSQHYYNRERGAARGRKLRQINVCNYRFDEWPSVRMSPVRFGEPNHAALVLAHVSIEAYSSFVSESASTTVQLSGYTTSHGVHVGNVIGSREPTRILVYMPCILLISRGQVYRVWSMAVWFRRKGNQYSTALQVGTGTESYHFSWRNETGELHGVTLI